MYLLERDGRDPGGDRGKSWNKSPLERAGGHPPGTRLDRMTPKDTRPWPSETEIRADTPVQARLIFELYHPETRPKPIPLSISVGISEPQRSYLTPASNMALSPQQIAAGEYFKEPNASEVLDWLVKLPKNTLQELETKVSASGISIRKTFENKGKELADLKVSLTEAIQNRYRERPSLQKFAKGVMREAEKTKENAKQAWDNLADTVTYMYFLYQNDPGYRKRVTLAFVDAVVAREIAQCTRSPIPFPSEPPALSATVSPTSLPSSTPYAPPSFTPVASAASSPSRIPVTKSSVPPTKEAPTVAPSPSRPPATLTPVPPTATKEAPTATATAVLPDVHPKPWSSAIESNPNNIPSEFFDKSGWRLVGDYYFSGKDLGPGTVLERLPEYQGFSGPVVHAKIGQPLPGGDRQFVFVLTERAGKPQQPEGPWAYRASINVLNAPKDLQENTNTTRQPWAILTSLQMHVDATKDDGKFRTAAGIKLWFDRSAGKYFISMYGVGQNKLAFNPNPSESFPAEFKIGEKQAIQVELDYEVDEPVARGFLIRFEPNNGIIEEKAIYLGKVHLSSDLKPIRGDISWEGAYAGLATRDYEVVEGEATILR